ncbi:MAG TPA: DUF1236 domain-containing protein [Xanthobacteraceae bacterium]|nr:DUF1236 domain-containing protein [Xanthobacteraceae bacterium]
MRKLLLTTVAAAALTGYAGIASAQTMQNPPTGAGAGAAAKSENAKPAESKGALSGAIKGDVPGGHAQNVRPDNAKAAEEASPAAKPDQKLGQDQTKPMTPQGNAEEEKPGATTQKTGEEKSGAEQRGAQEDNAKDNTKSGMNSTAQSSGKAADSHGSMKLSQTQRTKIKSIVGRSSSARVTNVHFDVSVGVKIPTDVHVVVLPERIVEVVPEFRGYDYIIVGDNILIIDPDTHEIVDIIAA